MPKDTAAPKAALPPLYVVLPRDPKIKPSRIGAWMARVSDGWIIADDRDGLARFVEPDRLEIEATAGTA